MVMQLYCTMALSFYNNVHDADVSQLTLCGMYTQAGFGGLERGGNTSSVKEARL